MIRKWENKRHDVNRSLEVNLVCILACMVKF